MRNTLIFFIVGTFFTAFLQVSGPQAAFGWGQPEVDNSKTTQKLQSLPRRQGERRAVTIYEFRSTVPEISASSGTDMFATALIKSGAFRVLERQRLHEGVMMEKQINSQGMTTGDSAQHLLVGADYIFEGTISEANPEESNTGLAGAFRGLGMEGSSKNAAIGLDIRVVDARTGEVLDSVNVRKKVGSKGMSIGGVGSFVQSFTKKGLDGADVAVSHDRNEGVDKALRECIEESIYQLVTRYGS